MATSRSSLPKVHWLLFQYERRIVHKLLKTCSDKLTKSMLCNTGLLAYCPPTLDHAHLEHIKANKNKNLRSEIVQWFAWTLYIHNLKHVHVLFFENTVENKSNLSLRCPVVYVFRCLVKQNTSLKNLSRFYDAHF